MRKFKFQPERNTLYKMNFQFQSQHSHDICFTFSFSLFQVWYARFYNKRFKLHSLFTFQSYLMRCKLRVTTITKCIHIYIIDTI